jgi:hypothetical protein
MQVFKSTEARTASEAIEVRVSYSDTPNLLVGATAIMMVMTPII